MSTEVKVNPTDPVNGLLPEWGQEADEMFRNYQLLSTVLNHPERDTFSEDVATNLTKSRDLLTNTLVRLIQDLPATSERVSDEDPDWIDLFRSHTELIRTINLQINTVFEDIRRHYPEFKIWLHSRPIQ